MGVFRVKGWGGVIRLGWDVGRKVRGGNLVEIKKGLGKWGEGKKDWRKEGEGWWVMGWKGGNDGSVFKVLGCEDEVRGRLGMEG